MNYLNELIIGAMQPHYFLLFLVIVIEGPIATVVAGALSAANQMNFLIAYFIAVAGDLVGDAGYYLFGRWGDSLLISRWGPRFGITKERIIGLEKIFKHNGGRTLLVGKLTHGIGGAFLVSAGIAKMPFGRYLWYNVLGTVPKALILMLFGYFFGIKMASIKSFFDILTLIFIAMLVAGVLAFFFWPKKKSDQKYDCVEDGE